MFPRGLLLGIRRRRERPGRDSYRLGLEPLEQRVLLSSSSSLTPALTLQAPVFSRSTTPTVTVTTVDKATWGPQAQLVLDVDRNHDGDFNDPGERAVTRTTWRPGSMALTL